MEFVLEVFTAPPFEENTYLVGDSSAGEAVVVDPGGRAGDIVRVAKRRGVRITAILNTHAHIDHVAGVKALQELTGAPFYLHADAEPDLRGVGQQALMFGLPPVDVPEVDEQLYDEQAIDVGDLRLAVRATPGHAAGHITLVGPEVVLEGVKAPFALCGDVIFMGSIGRTDLPGGDHRVLMTAIEEVILELPDSTVLMSGHGPATTVGHERRNNPFVRDWLMRKGGA